MSGANDQGYTIRKVSRYDAGRYSCTADNGVGMPAVAYVNLQVLCEYDSQFRARGKRIKLARPSLLPAASSLETLLSSSSLCKGERRDLAGVMEWRHKKWLLHHT